MRNRLFSAASLALALLAAPALAQDYGSTFSGFSSSSNSPIQIEADSLEVHDAEKLAIYSGHVRVKQGETLLEAPQLRIFYRGQAATGAVTGSQVDRIEAGPGVTVRSKDQVATADQAVFETAKDLITMQGNVVVTKGQNVVRGARLVVDLATKQGRMEGGRVQTLIEPSHGAGGK
jgi:lipopolysaccharide export system protein LptA